MIDAAGTHQGKPRQGDATARARKTCRQTVCDAVDEGLRDGIGTHYDTSGRIAVSIPSLLLSRRGFVAVSETFDPSRVPPSQPPIPFLQFFR